MLPRRDGRGEGHGNKESVLWRWEVRLRRLWKGKVRMQSRKTTFRGLRSTNRERGALALAF